MKIPITLSKLIAAMPLVIMSASACWASHQPDCSPAAPTVEIERLQPVAIDEELARSEHRAYVMEVARHLLHGQRSQGDCPPTSDPRACLLAARLLWLEAEAEALDGRPGDTAHSLRVRASELVRSGSTRAAADRQFLWALAQGIFADPQTPLDYGFQRPELRSSAIAELRRREPGNLQVWLLGSEDEAWTEERLSAAAASERSDSPIWEFIRSDLKLLQDAGAPEPPIASLGEELDALDAQHVYLLGIYLAIAQPGLYSLSRACSVEGDNVKPEAAEHCLRIAKVLVEGADSTLDLGLGSALMSRMSMKPEDRVRAADASQLFRYLSEAHMESQKRCGGLAAHLRRMRVSEASELSALREGLVDEGLPREPPQSWRVPTD